MFKFNTFQAVGAAYSAQSGQSMVEVLASVVIFSIGILGALGLQTASLSLNQSSYYRAQAVMTATDIIERMRANENGVQDGFYDAYSSSSPPANPGCINGYYCNDEARAQYDLFHWSNNFTDVGLVDTHKPLLPGGEASITFNEATQEHEVTVSWVETDWDMQGSGTKTDQTKSVVMTISI